jgi:hypothetical protein
MSVLFTDNYCINEYKHRTSWHRSCNIYYQKGKYMYKKGDRIQMIKMSNDPNPIESGAKGTVLDVVPLPWDSEIQIQVCWDNGRSLNVILPHDKITKLYERK